MKTQYPKTKTKKSKYSPENYSYLPDETAKKDITLNIIVGDDHIFCHSIYMEKTNMKGDQHV